MHTFLRRMCYRMSRRHAGKTHEERERTYDMLSHGWMIEAMKMWEIVDNIVNLFESRKETWRTELTACNESLGGVNIRRGIFQGDSFSPLLFVVDLIPLSIILDETDLGYVTSRN